MKPHLSCKSFFTVLVPMVVLSLAAGTVNSATTTVNYQVSASADDGYAWSATEQDIGSSYLVVGDDRTYTAPYYMSAMRFTNIDAPRNAHIVDAHLKISSISEGFRGQIYGVIQAETADDVTDFSSRYIGAMSKTTEAIAWDHKDAWAANTYYTSPDISSVIQEVVSRAGWNSGNSMAIYYSTRAESGKSRMFGSFESGAGFAAVLEITYETYSISGYIKTSDRTGVEGVTVSAGADIESSTTDAGGYYELFIPPGWSGTVTPSKTDWGFNPASRTYSNVTSGQINQDYTAFQPKISGYVKDGTGSGVEGVQVSADNEGGSDITNLNGYYQLTVPYDWSGNISADLYKWDFSPANYALSEVISDQTNINFTANYIGIITVKADGSGDFVTIQAAIDAAVNGDVVVLQAGTYTGSGNRDIDFLGKAITVRGATGDANDCVIECQGTETEPHRGFKFVSGEDGNSVLEAIAITNGYGPEEDIYGNGNLRSVGGSVYCKNSRYTINNCILRDNSADIGGGIYNRYSSPTISNCTINGNSASWGGGISNGWFSYPIINHCVIINNSAFYSGAGTPPSSGGGIFNKDRSSPIISNCTVSNNSARHRGGGIGNYYNSNPSISNCTLSNNSAIDYGGGIYNYSSSNPSINNCTINDNSANAGGGIGNYYNSNPTIGNCTISNNSVSVTGGGIYNDGGSSSISSCIIWGNSPPQIYGTALVTYSDIQGGSAGVGNIDADPCFVDDYRLSAYSPCVDAGDPDYMSGPNETDIDGDPRVVGRLDMGADEFFVYDSGALFITTKYYEFQALGIDSNTPPHSLSINNYGELELNWQIEIPNDCDWLSVTTLSGQTASLETSEVSISIDHNNIDYGNFSCQLTISDPNAENSPQIVTVSLEVLRPELTVSPSQFYFETALDEPNTAEQILSIQNTGYDTLYWDINIPFGCDWLNISEIAGESTGEVDEVILSVDAVGLDYGFYDCELTISDPNAENSPLTVHVTLKLFTADQVYVPSESPTIQEAIDVTIDGAEVIIEPGRYTGPGNCDIDFRGKAITVRSVDPNNPAVVAATIIEPNTLAIGFRFRKGEQADSVVDGLTIRRCIGRAAIDCSYSSPTIRNCIIEDNYHYDLPYHGGAGIACYDSSPVISNCVIRNNYGGGLRCKVSDPTVRNCIFTGNRGAYNRYYYGETSFGGGILSQGGNISVINCTFSGNVADVGGGICSFGGYGYGSNMNNMIISNCIFRDNDANDGPQIALIDYKENPPAVSVSYSDVQGGKAAVYVDPCCTLDWDDDNNLDIEPCFAVPGYWHTNDTPGDVNDDFWVDGDYHLSSQSGRWDPNSEIWYIDANTSPCIDAGDPNSDWTAELWPHGRRINIGAYGGTPEASMSLSDAGNIAELNGDDSIGYADIILFMGKWLYEAVLLAEDLDRNGFVNFADFAIFANNWEGTPGQASNPDPADGVRGVDPNADLNWTAGYGATSHDVYFGSSSLSFIFNQVVTIFEPGTMTEGTTYYWRIDEVNTGGKTAGQVWSFTTFGPPPPPPLPPPRP